MSIRTNIKDMVVGQAYSNVFLLKQHTVRQTQAGKDYLDLVIQDRTGEISGKLWTIPDTIKLEEIKDSDFIVLQFLVEEYQGNKQAKITNIRTVRKEDNFNKNELVPLAPESAESMYKEIIDTAINFNNINLKKVTTTALKEKKEKLMDIPGAKSMHHAVLGGLLYHMVGMLRTAKAISSVYPSVKKELLYAGVILHDISKLEEFETGPVGLVSDYTARGKLLGHIHMGAKYIGDLCESLKVDEQTNMLLQHMILSHHGIPEHGSAVTPMFLEAELLHLCDRIDSRVYMFNEAVQDLEENSFSNRVYGLDNKQIYNFKLDNNSGLNMDLTDNGIY